MNEIGSFKRKKGFTIAGNSVTRDRNLSLKSKGLYLLIMSYITYEDIDLSKSFLLSKCCEGKKAFCSAWDELKEKGYLKVYLKPSNKGWQVEYELLDEAKEGAHTYYLSADGNISNTNLTRNNRVAEVHLQEHLLQNGTNAERNLQNGSNGHRSNANVSNAKGDNNIITLNNTIHKPIINNQSISQEDGRLSENKLMEIVEEELKTNSSIPYWYQKSIPRMTTAIHLLADWFSFYPHGFNDGFKQNTYNLLVECLIEMTTSNKLETYKGCTVSSVKVIDKINECIQQEQQNNLTFFIQETMDDFITATSNNKVNALKKYMKSCIWNSFSTYKIKFNSFFHRTYYNFKNE